jgi:hypothetical protein
MRRRSRGHRSGWHLRVCFTDRPQYRLCRKCQLPSVLYTGRQEWPACDGSTGTGQGRGQLTLQQRRCLFTTARV